MCVIPYSHTLSLHILFLFANVLLHSISIVTLYGRHCGIYIKTGIHTYTHPNTTTVQHVCQWDRRFTLASAAHSTHCRSFCRRRERVRKQSQQEFPNRKKRGVGRREGGHDGVEGREVVDTAHCHCYPSPSLKIAASIKPLMILALCHGSVRERDQNVWVREGGWETEGAREWYRA